uniref:Glucuronosyltransferase n=1 Tax=Anopheles atroparvus TaxID=41427 RepID=A0A182JC23_ANOAO
MPQNDLLAHPNIKLFITHSGLLSTQEAIWHGVPVIGFPLFADQFRNINYCVAAGIAKRLRIQNFKATELVNAIKEILGEEKYAKKMKEVSRLFRDQPETPLERAVWWCEWRPLMYEMGKRGHNVTVISADIEKKPPANVSYIHLENFYSTMFNLSMSQNIDYFEMANESPITMLRMIDEFGMTLCEAGIKSEGLQFLLNYPKEFKFDLFVSDIMIGPCLPSIIMHRFKDIPYIPATPYNAPSTTASVLGTFAFSGMVPNHVYDVPESMSFVQRVKNFIYDTYEMILHEVYMHPEADRILRTLYPGAPSTSSFYKNVRVSFINANPIIQYKEPMMPNMIPVGGLQIQPPQPLPEDLRKIVEAAPNGFILFSLG